MDGSSPAAKAVWKKSDLAAILIIGELVACLAFAILQNARNDLFFYPNLLATFGSALNMGLFLAGLVPLAALACLYAAYFLGQKFPVVFQAAKFVSVGILNTLIDWGVLTLQVLFTGVNAGMWYGLFKSVSFLAAVSNSFIWNKCWTFKKHNTGKTKQELSQFFLVSFIGFFINVGVASFVVNVIGPQAGISYNLWATVGGAVATVFSMVWDFVAYKFIVFKK
ncbi:MAG: GtrA family protein [Candidatus Paceibacterota bacterium]|jgi:putative flippase GtrA